MKIPAVFLFSLFVLWMRHPLTAQTLAEAIDQPSLTVTASGGWQASTDPALTHDGTDSAVCTLSASSYNPINTSVTGPARIAWWWRMTGTGSGRLGLYSQSTYPAEITTPSTTWVRAEITVPAGTHALSWTAARTQGTVSFAVDEVSVQPWGGRGFIQWRDDTPPAATAAIYEPTAMSVATTATGNWLYPQDPWYYAVRSNGTVVSWGSGSQSAAVAAPAGLSNVASIAAGATGAMALHRDGTVTGWGMAAPVPAGINNAVRIAAGFQHYVVLGSDGRVRVWGTITRRGTDGIFVPSSATVAQDLPRFTQVGAAGSYSLGLTADGKVVRWSDTTSFETMPDLPQPVSAFSASGDTSAAPNSGSFPGNFSLAGLTFNGSAIAGSAAAFASDVVEILHDPIFYYSGKPWAIRRDGSLVNSANQTVTGVPIIATASIRSKYCLAITGDPTLPPEFVSADSALAFAASAPVAATRVWYQCAVVNGAQTYAATGLPPGLTLDAASGRVYGQPTASGAWDTVFTATSAAGTGQKTVRFYTDTTLLPVLNGGSRSAIENTPFTHSLTSAGSPPVTSYTMGTLPAWLSFDFATGILSGTPPASGVFSISFKAVNVAGTTSGTLSITVNVALPVVSSASRTAHEGDWFGHQITSTGAPHTAYGAAPLPAGLTRNGGIIFGRLTSPGVHDITLSVTNAAGIGTANLHLEVLPSASPPRLTVTTAADELDTPAGAAVSLREAFRDVPPGGVIQFARALQGQTLTLTRGPLRLDIPGRELFIQAALQGVTVSGGNASRIFEISKYTILNLAGLTLQDGRAPIGTASFITDLSPLSGGAVWNEGFFTAVDCTFSNNKAGTGFTHPNFPGPGQFGYYGGPGGTGGAIHSSGTVLELMRCRFRNNQGGRGGNGTETGENTYTPGPGGNGGGGGAVWAATLTAVDCEFTWNTAGGGGNGGRMRRPDEPIAGNGGNGGNGGAVFATSATLQNCWLSGNTSGSAGLAGTPNLQFGGIDGNPGSGGAVSAATVNLVNCTLHGNSTAPAGTQTASSGYATGGAMNFTGGRVVHCTITSNAIGGAILASPAPSAARGGGVSGTAALTIENSIIAGNTALFADGHDIFGSLTYAGANLIGVLGSTAGPLNGTAAAPLSPGLLALTWNGGSTKTMRLYATSPASNAAVVSAATPATDQRGYPRITASAPDLGALEMEGSAVPALMIRDPGITTGPAGQHTLRWGYAAGTSRIEESTTLTPGSWTSVPGVTPAFDPDTGSAVAIIPATAGPRRYFKVVWTP